MYKPIKKDKYKEMFILYSTYRKLNITSKQ